MTENVPKRLVEAGTGPGLGQNAHVELLVAADDRTGAFETAAALADRGLGPVPVGTRTSGLRDHPVGVVDLACRHLSPAEAAERAAALPPMRWQAHKTDSTLRGNWSEELVARSVARPVLLVPALPAQGRTCVGGTVFDHGRPVHEGAAGTDVRRRVLTARPAEAIRAAGGEEVVELGDVDAVRCWLEQPSGLAVADAETDEAIEAIVAGWRERADAVVLAGTSTVIGRTAGLVGTGAAPAPFPEVDGPVLVVCGSVHPASRRQLEFAEHRGVHVTYLADEITVRALEHTRALIFATEIPVGDVDAPMAVAAAASLARGVADLRAGVRLGAIVILGGDTAAAVIGDAAAEVVGSLDDGTAWVRADGFDMPIVTRSGGFGSDRALLDLMSRLGPR